MKKYSIYRIFILIIIFSAIYSCSIKPGAEESGHVSVSVNSPAELKNAIAISELNPDSIELMTTIWNYYIQNSLYTDLVEHALPIYLRAVKAKAENVQVYAGLYLAQAYRGLSQFDEMNAILQEITEIAEHDGAPFLVAALHNTVAIHAMQSEMNYIKAVDHFKKALDIIKESGDLYNEGILLSNIATIYHHRNDTTGMRYAKEAYEIGVKTGDEYTRWFSTLAMTNMHYLLGNYDEAMNYAEESLTLSELQDNEYEPLTVYLAMAEILVKMGNINEAEYYYNQAYDKFEGSDPSTIISAYLGLGNFMLVKGDYRKAEEFFREGLDMSFNKNNIEIRKDLLRGLSNAYEKQGKEKEALVYYKMYHADSDSIFNIEKERAFNDLLMQYEKANYEKSLQEKELRLVKAHRKNLIIIYISIMLTVILGSTYILYRRKNKMYRQLVEQHQEYLRREKHLLADEHKEEGVTHEASLGNDLQLFRQLEELMNSEHVYRNNDISLEKLAEMLQSNRSYISRIINQYAGMSFYNYINSRRIEETVLILSDPENDIPLKVLSDQLGYNSMSAFYRSFQKETGVPPSKYRETVKKMHRGKVT